MFTKRIVTGQMDESRPKTEFPKGTKFVLDSRIWKVTEEIVDNTETWRRVMSDDGTEEILSMHTLKKDLQADVITFLDKW